MARLVQVWRDEVPPAPMLATAAEPTAVNLDNPALIYEQKFDGIRAIVVVEPGRPTPRVAILSRNGHDKSAQFPEIVRALRELSAQVEVPLVLDGEIVALDSQGRPASFSALQSRMHLTGAAAISSRAATTPTALVVFDLLREGKEDLRPLPLADRRARLEHLLHVRTSEHLREGGYTAGDGRRVLARAEREGWEGVVVKHADAPYLSDTRSRTWRKVKLHKRATLVIGGWTDPKGTRAGFGALMVGTPVTPTDENAVTPIARRDGPCGRPSLQYAGNVGTGFSVPTINAVLARLRPLATARSPFVDPPAGRGHHWVEPHLLCEVRFGEWTPDGRLRHPVFLGLRDDVGIDAVDAPPSPADARTPYIATHDRATHTVFGATGHAPEPTDLVTQIRSLEDAGRDGTLTLPDGALDVTSLRKVFWPSSGLTKGDLFRYYARIAPWLLPIVADRPLVMKRYPNGVQGKSFYQQRAPDAVPAGVRVAIVDGDDRDEGPTPRIIGGSLSTLLYLVQLGAISFDPWFSRVDTPSHADFVAIDLDPMPGVPFTQVRDVARWVHEALDALDVPAAVKTSGSSGLHVYLPLAPGTSYESGQLLCQIVATAVASRHPKAATVERAVARRGRTVYVDYLQNIEGKTLASAYSVRANEFAGVSTPLLWHELDEDVRPDDFTLAAVMQRFDAVGDIWNPVLRGRPVDLHAVLDRLT
ncbi:MAG: DNA ligase D [Acidobacteria bacterium]|nr:DNA ligase D [Acidobacteriota bacterium]